MSQKKNLEQVILIYTRPWFVDFYGVLASKMEAEFGHRVVFFSDYAVEKTHNISPKKSNITTDNFKVKSEYFDIIKRDRVLRNEPWNFSVALLKEYQSNISALFERYDVRFVFSATVDQFAIDMVYRHCLKLKTPFIGYHMSVIPGYTLLTNRGEHCYFRELTDNEVVAGAELIAPKSFRPDYIPRKGKLRLSGLGRLFANIARVPFFFCKDFFTVNYNYHYIASFRAALSSVGFSILRLFFSTDYKLKDGDKFDIYIPLQLHPECNSEYWSRDSEYQDYEDLIYRFCERYSKSFRICIKDHPNMVGLRKDIFFKKYRDLGVVVVDVEEDNRELIECSKVLVTYNSSAGIEGMVYGASILCLGEPYYLTDGHISNEEEMVDVLTGSLEMSKEEIKNDFLHDAIRKTLSMSVSGWLPDTTKFSDQSYDNELDHKATIFVSQLKKNFPKIVAKKLTLEEVFTYKESKYD
ncbi:MAG: hypothetical protein CMQ54_01970 [Gammaproteobacteria bacterium]|nr:hypothetical protein [Gammaproteobacteria bacterium]